MRVVRDLTRLLQYVPEGDRRCEGVRRSVVRYAAAIGFAIEAHMRKGRTGWTRTIPRRSRWIRAET